MFAGENLYTFQQGGIRDTRFVILYGLFVLLALRALYRGIRRRWKAVSPGPPLPAHERFLMVFFVVSFVAWEASFSIFRYAVCMEAVAPLLIVIAICALWRNRFVRTALIVVAFVGTAVMMRPFKQERIPWGTSFWQLQVPAVADPQDALIIIANSRPVAYFAPHFPPEVRWVGLKNNLTDPARPTEMQQAIHGILDAHHGEMYLLTQAVPNEWLHHDAGVLKTYGLTPVPGSGRPIESRHSPSGLQLWRVQRIGSLELPSSLQ